MLIVSIKETEPAVERASKRPSLLLSALVHVIMITLLIRTATGTVPQALPVSPAPAPAPTPRAVFLPPAAELRKLIPALPPRRPAAPAPTPAPTPPPQEARDRISVGPPSQVRQREPLLLERDRDLSSAPAAPGRPGPPALPSPRATPEVAAQTGGGEPQAAATPAPAGRGQAPLAAPPRGERSITSSLRNLEQRLGEMGGGGLGNATGQQMGPLFFDPEGADFTAWINHFKNEVYRNWIVPQSALMGAVRGHVDFEFSVQRDGTLAEVRLLKSSGTPALDRAAANALIGSRYLALPSDYRPARVTMQVSFYYGEGPRG
jgi:TonB family protein